jgi:hypothetical protein
MMRNYSVALAIIFGRYVGTLLLFTTPFSWWRSADAFETLNILFSWLITFSLLEFYLQCYTAIPMLISPQHLLTKNEKEGNHLISQKES